MATGSIVGSCDRPQASQPHEPTRRIPPAEPIDQALAIAVFSSLIMALAASAEDWSPNITFWL